MTGGWQDIHDASRALRRTPGFTVIAISVLAVGIGATGAIFGFVDAAIIRALTFGDADRLVMLFGVRPIDPATLLGAAAVLALTAVSACAAPAIRATRVDPVGRVAAGLIGADRARSHARG